MHSTGAFGTFLPESSSHYRHLPLNIEDFRMELILLSLTALAIVLITGVEIPSPQQPIRVLDRETEMRLERWRAQSRWYD
jgi:hypothetical protein